MGLMFFLERSSNQEALSSFLANSFQSKNYSILKGVYLGNSNIRLPARAMLNED
jgi:hypothetical protein